MSDQWNDSQPIYRQLRDRVIAMILDSVLKEGDSLPSVRTVAADYRVNPLTVLKAYQQLADEQIVEKRRGIGMFVKTGVRQQLLRDERQRFLKEEWPGVLATLQRLGLRAEDLLTAVDVPLGLLPPLHRAGAPAGAVTPGAEAETGLPRGLPVHLGGGDTHMSAMAAGALTDPAPVVVAGTTGPAQLAVRRNEDQPPGDYFPLLVSEQPVSGAWALESNAGPTGEIVDRLADLPGARGAELRAALDERGFDLGPDSGGPEAEQPLTVLSGNPFFGPAGWSAWPPPTVLGLRADHTGEDVRLAGLRGTCWAFAAILDQLREHSGAHPVAVTATGGMSRSPAWNQALADAARLPVQVRPLDLVSGLAGAALVAGAELLTSLDQIESTRYLPSARPDHDLAGQDHYQIQFRAAQCGAR